jgi:hypothetical protein
VYGLVIVWLGERDDPQQDLGADPAGSGLPAGGQAPRPPRGWRLPPH